MYNKPTFRPLLFKGGGARRLFFFLIGTFFFFIPLDARTFEMNEAGLDLPRQAPVFDFNPGRPALSTGVMILRKNTLSLETSFIYKRIDKNTFQWTNADCIRYAPTRRLEIAVRSGYHWLNRTNSPSEKHIEGMKAIGLFAKLNILEKGENARPGFALATDFNFPFFSSKSTFIPKNVAPSVYVFAGQNLGKGFGINYNFGLEWDGESPAANGFYSVYADYAPIDRLGVFFEGVFYDPPGKEIDLIFNLGFNLYLIEDLMFDFSVGLYATGQNPKPLFVDIGLSYGIKLKK